MTTPHSKKQLIPKLQRQQNLYANVKADKVARWEEVAIKLAFRDYIKEKGINKTEADLHMQEIYNRYFFFRKDEIKPV